MARARLSITKRISRTRAGRTVLAYVLLWLLVMACVWYVSVWLDALNAGH